MKSFIEELQKENKEELLKKSLMNAHQNNDKCHSFVTILDNAKTNKQEGILANIPYALKDNFSTKGILTTGSSNTLKDYVPVYNSTVYEKLLASGAICIGKTVMDEFGMGGSGTTGHTGPVFNPWNTKRIAGGSSSGSAVAVASSVVPFALGSDTGDSIRKPAAYNGIVGFKPTYGMISRWGLFPFASSLDHVGVLTRSVKDAAIVVDAIKGQDEKDMTSWDSSNIHLVESLEKNKKKDYQLFYIKEIADISSYPNPSAELKSTLELFQETLKKIKNLGITVTEVSMDQNLLNAMASVYTCISCAEATSNMSNLTGIIFGPRGEGNNIYEMMKSHRTEGFSPLIKRRFVIGSYVLQKENQEKYFVNAQRIRHLIVNQMKDYFKEYDACILPCSKGASPLLTEPKDMMQKELSALENNMVIGNFGGFPSITIPNGFINEMPVGINLTSNIKEDAKVLCIASIIEDSLPYVGQIAGGK